MDILAILELIAYALIGAVLCFFGSRWAKIIVAIYGFAGGFLLAYALLPLMFTALGSTLILFISLGVGLIVALLFVLLFYVGIFFVGFGAGVALCLLVIRLFSLNPIAWYVYIPALIICCILGSLTLNNRRIFLSIFTAYIGASALAIVIDQLFNLKDGITMPAISMSDPSMFTQQTSLVYLISLGVLFVAGLVIQLAVTSKKQLKKAD